MKQSECNSYVDVSRQLMFILSGQQIGFDNIKDIRRIIDCSGAVILLEMDAQVRAQASAEESEAVLQQNEHLQRQRDVPAETVLGRSVPVLIAASPRRRKQG